MEGHGARLTVLNRTVQDAPVSPSAFSLVVENIGQLATVDPAEGDRPTRKSAALATDCSPGSNFSSSMLPATATATASASALAAATATATATAVHEFGMAPLKALAAAVRGRARALRRADAGHLRVGARRDPVILDAPVTAIWRTGPACRSSTGCWSVANV